MQLLSGTRWLAAAVALVATALFAPGARADEKRTHLGEIQAGGAALEVTGWRISAPGTGKFLLSVR